AGPGWNPARPADPPVVGVPSTATTARPYQARDVPRPAEQPALGNAWPASVVPERRVPYGPAAQAAFASAVPGRAARPAAPAARRVSSPAAAGATAKRRPRRRRWVVAVSAVAALLGIAAGTVVWAHWV